MGGREQEGAVGIVGGDREQVTLGYYRGGRGKRHGGPTKESFYVVLPAKDVKRYGKGGAREETTGGEMTGRTVKGCIYWRYITPAVASPRT